MTTAHTPIPLVRCSPGLIEVTDREAFAATDRKRLRSLVARIAQVPAVTSVAIDHRQGRVAISFAEELGAATVLRGLTGALRGPQIALEPGEFLGEWGGESRDFTQVVRAGSAWSVWHVDSVVLERAPVLAGSSVLAGSQVPGGPVKRAVLLLLAGGSFSMSIVGVVVPGIPTVPFLLLTSYFLVRSSPRLNQRLLRSRTLGPMLRDWQRHRGLSLTSKSWLLGVIAVTVGLTLLLTEPPAWLLAVMLVMVGLSTYYTLTIPTVRPDDQSGLEMGLGQVAFNS